MRKTIVLPALATFSVAGCVSNNGYGNQQPLNNAAVRTVGGAAAGAVIADVTGGSKTKGALIGAVVGGASCAVPGTNNCY